MGIKLRAEDSKQTLDIIREQGFTIAEEFEGINPVMPNDITDLDDLGVMRLYQEYNAFLQFVLAQVTCAQIDEVNAKKKLDFIEARLMETYTQPKMTVSAIKAKVSMDTEYVAALATHSVAYDYRKGMEMMCTNVERDCNFISRDLTRRTSTGFSRSSKFTT
jgi:hypothetical protein